VRILCVADHVDPLVHSTRVRDRFGDVDLVISAGDLPMEYLGFLAGALNKPLLFVFGNHNLDRLPIFRKGMQSPTDWDGQNDAFRNYFGSTYVGDRVVCCRGLLIAGLGGSLRYNDGENQFTERQMMRKVVRLVPRLLFNRLFHGRFLDILLTHAPPKGVHDKDDLCHTGFAAFRWLIDRFRPRYLLHGHVHLYDRNEPRETQVNQTTVINVYDHYVLDIEP
jgi:uncharacterized protein